MGKNLTLTNLLAAFGTASIASLTVLIPYNIGYFGYFDVRFMGLFSISDLYLFSALPIIAVNGFVIASTLFMYAVVRSVAGALPKVIASPLFVIVLLWGCLPCLVLYSSGVVLLGFLSFIVLQGLVRIVERQNDLKEYFYVFIALELILVIWGQVLAMERSAGSKSITIEFGNKSEIGSPIFIGAAGVLLLQGQQTLKFVRTDNGTTIALADIPQSRTLGCLEWRPLIWIRETLKVSCS